MTGRLPGWLLSVAAAAMLVTACAPSPTDPLTAKGRRLYAHYCADCHGPQGRGDGHNARHLDPAPRDLTDRDELYMARLTNEQIVEVIAKGGRGIEQTPLMPAFGHTLSEEEIWAVTAYVRTLHPHTQPPVAVPAGASRERPRGPAVPRDAFAQAVSQAVRGAELASVIRAGRELVREEYGCIACHRVEGSGGEIGPDLGAGAASREPGYIYRWIKNPQAMKPGVKMPTLAVPDREAVAMALYLTAPGRPSLRGGE